MQIEYQVLLLRWAWSRSRDPFFLHFDLNHIFRIDEVRHFKCRLLIDTEDRYINTLILVHA